jgi:hypothetical protein
MNLSLCIVCTEPWYTHVTFFMNEGNMDIKRNVCHHSVTEQAGTAVTYLTCIFEVPGPILAYTFLYFLWSLQENDGTGNFNRS